MFNKRLLTLIKDKYYITLTVLAKLLGLFCSMAAILLFAESLRQTLSGGFELTKQLPYFAIILGVLLLRFALMYISGVFSIRAMSGVKRNVRTLIYEKLLKLPDYKQEFASAQAVQLTTEGVEQIENYVSRFLPQFFYSMIAPIFLFALLAFYNLKTATVLIICVPLIPMIIVIMIKIAKKILAKYWDIYLGLSDSFLENLQGLTTLKIFRRDEDKHIEMNESAENFRKVTMKVLSMQLNSITIMDILAYGGAALGIILTLIDYNAGTIGFYTAFITVLLAAEFFLPLRLLGSYFHTSMNSMAAAKKIFDIIDLDEGAHGDKVLDGRIESIVFKDTDFSYDEKREVLKNVNLTINRGEFIGIAGESGSGKSTFGAIIAGLNKDYGGSIKLNDLELKDIEKGSIFSNIMYAAHSGFIFSGSIRENLLFGNENADEKELISALKKVDMLDTVEKFGGLDYQLDFGGSNISGGQAQRLSLGRALLADRQIYIFDEVSSNIDVESEKIIMQAIDELKKTKTVIMISHRLKNIETADKILVFDDGEIVEMGTHIELLKQGGTYKALHDTQAEIEKLKLKGER